MEVKIDIPNSAYEVSYQFADGKDKDAELLVDACFSLIFDAIEHDIKEDLDNKQFSTHMQL